MWLFLEEKTNTADADPVAIVGSPVPAVCINRHSRVFSISYVYLKKNLHLVLARGLRACPRPRERIRSVDDNEQSLQLMVLVRV